jgi:hypothetical protein
MTFLELCQRLVQEAGISGGGPPAVTNQTGMKKKVVDWVARAWRSIQSEHEDWNFLWTPSSFQTVLGQRDYDPVRNLQLNPEMARPDVRSFRIYPTALGPAQQGSLIYVPWSEWQMSNWDVGIPTAEVPLHFTVLPSGVMRLDAIPVVAYTVEFAYYRVPFVLSANGDTPVIQERFHDIILYQALLYYAAHEDAPEIERDARINFTTRMMELRRSYLPRLTHPQMPLA